MAWQPNPGMGKAHETAQARMSVNQTQNTTLKIKTGYGRNPKGCKRVNAHVRYAQSTRCTWLMFVALIVYVYFSVHTEVCPVLPLSTLFVFSTLSLFHSFSTEMLVFLPIVKLIICTRGNVLKGPRHKFYLISADIF